MATVEQAMTILVRLEKRLASRQNDITTYTNAYEGAFGKLQYASDDFKEFFSKRYDRFSDNWCGIVADAPHERLEIIGIEPKGSNNGDAELWDAWRRAELDAQSDLAMLDAINAKRAYSLVWGKDEDQPVVTFEHPSQAIVEYDPETRKRRAGAKIWADDKTEYATLYLPESVWKFQRSNTRETVNELQDRGFILPPNLAAEGWQKRQPDGEKWPLDNPLGEVPLVEWPNRPRLMREPMSDIAGTLAMQHSINLLWSQLFTASDHASWPQKVISGAVRPTLPVFDDEGNQIGEKDIPLKELSLKRIHWLEDPNAKIDQWDAAKLDVWTDVIEIAVGHIAAQTRTPAHYLLIGGTIANVSGDAMKALETGLVKRTEEKTNHFGRAARETFRLMAKVMGDESKAEAVALGRVRWKDIENISEAQQADALLKKQQIGYPLEYLMELDGIGPTERQRILEMVDAQNARDPLSALSGNILRPVAGTPPEGTTDGSAPIGG